MKIREIVPLLGLLFVATFVAAQEPRLLDDFQTPGQSALGTQWQGFTDRVMGGVSTIQAGYVDTDEGNILSMRGQVSLANNGGFVQVRLPLASRGFFDASRYAGIAVEARGTPGSYYVSLRTAQTRAPWQTFEAPLNVTQEWQRIVIPFAAFEGDAIRHSIDLGSLASLAIVAGKVEFTAAIDIRRIELVASSDA